MNIDDLKSTSEDVTPIEEEVVEKIEEKELTPEQQEMQDKFFRSAIVKRYKLALKNLYYTMSKRKNTIDDVKKLIIDKTKTLPFTASQREFIMSFKDEFLVNCLKDIYNEKDLNEIDLTISEPVSTGTGDTGNVQSNS